MQDNASNIQQINMFEQDETDTLCLTAGLHLSVILMLIEVLG
jgi:hypothetical protein